PIDLSRYVWDDPSGLPGDWERCVDWVIVGGESGHGARPMHPDWARSLRDQCAAADAPFFFKQWGEHGPQLEDSPANAGKRFHMPPFPNAPGRVSEQQIMVRFGKKA